MKKFSELTTEEKYVIVKECETSTQKSVAEKFNISKEIVRRIVGDNVKSRIFAHNKITKGMVKNNFIKITLKDRTVLKGIYTGESEEAVNIIQEGFSFETSVVKDKIKHRETIVPYVEPTELEMLEIDEQKLIERLIENRKRQIKLRNEKATTNTN